MSDDLRLAAGWGVTAFGPFTVTALLTPLREQMHATTFVVVVLICLIGAAAILAGPTAGALATVMAVLSFDFFFIEPYLLLKVDADDGTWPLVPLVAAGSSIVFIARRRWSRSADTTATAASFQPNRSRHIERIVHLIQQGDDSNDLISAVQAELTGLLLARSCRFEAGDPTSTLPQIERNGTVAGRDGALPSQPEQVELPVRRGDRYVGRFVLTRTDGASVPLEHWIVAVILTDHLAAAVITHRPSSSGMT